MGGRVHRKTAAVQEKWGGRGLEERGIGEAEIIHRLSRWFSTGGSFGPKETFGKVWRHFGCHKLERVILA